MKNEKGFTLIELMIVIAIIALLAAVALPKLSGATDDAKVAQIRADLSTLRTSISMFNAKNGKYPVCLAKANGVNIGTDGSFDNITTGTSITQTWTATTPRFSSYSGDATNPGFYEKVQMPIVPVGSNVPSPSAKVVDGSVTAYTMPATTVNNGWWYNDTNGEIHVLLFTDAYGSGVNWRVE